jgi:hypothetical protein
MARCACSRSIRDRGRGGERRAARQNEDRAERVEIGRGGPVISRVTVLRRCGDVVRWCASSAERQALLRGMRFDGQAVGICIDGHLDRV